MLQTPDGVRLRYAAGAAARPQGTVCVFKGARNSSRNISRWCAICGRADSRSPPFDWRGQGLLAARAARPVQGHVSNFSEYATDLATFMKEVVLPDCPPPLFALAIRWARRC